MTDFKVPNEIVVDELHRIIIHLTHDLAVQRGAVRVLSTELEEATKPLAPEKPLLEREAEDGG